MKLPISFSSSYVAFLSGVIGASVALSLMLGVPLIVHETNSSNTPTSPVGEATLVSASHTEDIAIHVAGTSSRSESTVRMTSVHPSRISLTVPEWERITETITIENTGQERVHWSFVIGGSEQQMSGAHVAAIEDTSDVQLLQQEVAAQGTVPVIVKVRAFTQPEAWLDEAGRQFQREQIDDVQQYVLNHLGDHAQASWKSEYTSIVTMEVDEEGLRRLLDHDAVQWVKMDREDVPELMNATEFVGANAAHNLGYRGQGQTVAVLDGGIDTRHPFISGNVVEEACFNTNNPSNDISPLCANGGEREYGIGSACNTNLIGSNFNACRHGTMVSGIAVGEEASAAGASSSGVAPDAGLIAIAICSIRDGDSLSCRHSDQIRGMEYIFSLRHDYDIASINMSTGGGQYGTACDDDDARRPMIDQLYAAGIPFVTSAGNDGWVESVSAPACVSNAIAVGSVQDASPGQTADQISSFSNSSHMLDFWAPGEPVASSVPVSAFDDGGGGTSRASPMVAGAWAVAKSKWPEASIEEIRARLTQGGVPITDERSGYTRPRIQVDAALEDDMWIAAAPAAGRLEPGESEEITIAVNAMSLAPGQYLETIRFSGGDESEVDITINVAEQERSRLDFASQVLDAEIQYGASPEITKIVTNEVGEFGQTLELSVTDLPDFLAFNRAEGDGVRVTGGRVMIPAQSRATLVFDFVGEVVGPTAREGQIGISSNDPDHNEIELPVAVRVRAPLIALGSDDLQFSYQADGMGADEETLELANQGDATLSGSLEIIEGGENFSVQQDSFFVASGQTERIPVSYYREAGELPVGVLEIYHNAPNMENPVQVDLEPIPDGIRLAANYPNPFNNETTVEFSLDESGDARLDIFDMLGRRVDTLYDGELESGVHRHTWYGGQFSSGVYIVRLTVGNEQDSIQMTLVR